MVRILFKAGLVVLFFFASIKAIEWFLPDELVFQGLIQNGNGIAIPDGYYDFRAQLFDSPQDGNLLFSQDQNDVFVKEGKVILKTTPLADDVKGVTFLHVCFNSDGSKYEDGYTGGLDGIYTCHAEEGRDVFDNGFCRKQVNAQPYSLFSTLLGSTYIYDIEAPCLIHPQRSF